MSLLEQDTTKKGWVETAIELDKGNSKKYDVKTICYSAVYTRQLEGHLPGLYYLVSWKSYPEEENIWKPTSAVLYLYKLISTFYRDYPEKPTANSLPIDSIPPIARPIIKSRTKVSNTKQKRDRLVKNSSASKCAKKTWTSSFLSCFWHCLDSRQKISIVTWSCSASLHSVVWFFNSFHFSIFNHFSVFPPKHWLGGFFYQSLRSFSFLLPVS